MKILFFVYIELSTGVIPLKHQDNKEIICNFCNNLRFCLIWNRLVNNLIAFNTSSKPILSIKIQQLNLFILKIWEERFLITKFYFLSLFRKLVLNDKFKKKFFEIYLNVLSHKPSFFERLLKLNGRVSNCNLNALHCSNFPFVSHRNLLRSFLLLPCSCLFVIWRNVFLRFRWSRFRINGHGFRINCFVTIDLIFSIKYCLVFYKRIFFLLVNTSLSSYVKQSICWVVQIFLFINLSFLIAIFL